MNKIKELKQMKKALNNVNRCGDKNCSHVISSTKLNTIRQQHIKSIVKKCFPKKKPK